MPADHIHKRKLSKNLAVLLAIFGFCALIWMITMVKLAKADEIVQCGKPIAADLETNPGKNYCDIYARQLAYTEENKKYHEQLQERRRNFVAPSNEARQNYEQSRDALQRGDQSYNQ